MASLITKKIARYLLSMKRSVQSFYDNLLFNPEYGKETTNNGITGNQATSGSKIIDQEQPVYFSKAIPSNESMQQIRQSFEPAQIS